MAAHAPKDSTGAKKNAAAVLSMTGFGRSTSGALQVEARSINHRFLDLSIKVPRQFSMLEPRIRTLVQEKLKRGRVEILVSRVAGTETNAQVSINEGIFDAALRASERACKLGKVDFAAAKQDITVLLLGRSEVLAFGSADEPSAQEVDQLYQLIAAALDQLCAMRRVEGDALANDLRVRLSEIARMRGELCVRTELLPLELKNKLVERLSKIANELPLDPARLAQEAAIAADRIDVAEELTRLETHLAYFLEVLEREPNGRKLEFITQECLRELNTLGSKIQDGLCQRLVIDSKLEVERIREQLNNVE